MEDFRRTESWTSSEASSSESGEVSSVCSTTRSSKLEWTDEKHNLYLKSMEASFVDQLYDSMDFLGYKSQKNKFPGSKLSRQTHSTSSGQFKVLRGGCWKKINFGTPGFQPNTSDRSSCFMASPWIQHFRSGSDSRVFASCSHLQDHASSKEVSDQNFIDEKTSNERGSKKLKSVANDA
ncbi:Cold regulated protein 27, putative isoform 4 [Hibiscus syriacus]|uniref:Cold regulated protein 27, putative isoform 4 n=1 Tax=Hibiscus syriacus TaxID=106335 RepID=A0A6A2XWD1_HIBSY|nr:Cold regulated protein 27, putative isoform 4 [Hibiscus syriacus]